MYSWCSSVAGISNMSEFTVEVREWEMAKNEDIGIILNFSWSAAYYAGVLMRFYRGSTQRTEPWRYLIRILTLTHGLIGIFIEQSISRLLMYHCPLEACPPSHTRPLVV